MQHKTHGYRVPTWCLAKGLQMLQTLSQTQHSQNWSTVRNLMRKISPAVGNWLGLTDFTLPAWLKVVLEVKLLCFVHRCYVPCRDSSHKGLTAKGEKMFHRLHAGIHMGSLKCFFMSRLGQSPDLFPYLLNCLHNPPLVLEVSWRCWYCKGVVNDLSKNKLHPTSPGFSSALS